MLTSFKAGPAEEHHGGKEWGKSAAQIRKRHKDGRCMAVQSQTETNKRFDSRAGRRPGAADSSARGISPTREQFITINQRLIYLSKRLGLRARLFLSASLGNSINFRDAELFTASRVPLCENRIVYCAGRIRRFSRGKDAAGRQEVRHFTAGTRRQTVRRL